MSPQDPLITHSKFPWAIALFHPRYWPTWLGLGVLYLATRLPYHAQLRLGRQLGRMAYYLLRKLRRIAAINLQHCLPELEPQQQRQILKAHFESLGMGLIESAMAWWMPIAKLQPYLHVEGLEHLQAHHPHGVLVLSAHFTSLILCSHLLTQLCPMHVVYQTQKNRVVETFISLQGNTSSMRLIPRQAVRKLFRALIQGQVVWYAMDQDYGSNRHNVFVPFFAIPTATIATPSRYAKRTQAAVVTLFYHRLPNNQGYQIVIRPTAPDHFASNDVYQDATYFNTLLEAAIRAHPEQYWWIHRRFKTRPSDSPSLY